MRRNWMTANGAATPPAWSCGVRAGLLAVLLLIVAYQLPARHFVDLGGWDAAYTQGFPDRRVTADDGLTARTVAGEAFLIFPQVGLPARFTLDARSEDGAPHQLQLLLNGAPLPGAWTVTDAPRVSVGIASGLTKPQDVVLTVRTDGPLLLDSATFETAGWPILPYPVPLALGALAAALLAPLLALRWPRRAVPVAAGAVALAVLLFYRLQLPYSYPLRLLLPGLVAVLVGVWLVRTAEHPRWRVLGSPLVALALIGGWCAAMFWQSRAHGVLALPGVEADFRVFALRSAHLTGSFPGGTVDPALDGVLRADGFYNLGYPALLWLVRPFTSDNPFLAARVVAVLAGAALLMGGWLLARRLLGPLLAVLVLALLALTPMVNQYALSLGTDMPFAACCVLALAALIAGERRTTPNRRANAIWVLAGALAGLAFLMRHPGLLLLPSGWLVLAWRWRNWRSSVVFTAAFLLMVMPQVLVNTIQTGQPLFSWQAKNIWSAVYTGGDFSRWQEAPNDISLLQVLLRDPARFAANWAANVRAFLGAGGEDTSEFGRAVQLRLLAFPANWLALGGLLGWLWKMRWRRAQAGLVVLAGWAVAYALFVSVGLSNDRFYLPLVPVYALAAVWALARCAPRPMMLTGAALVLLALVSGGFRTGTQSVLARQNADEAAAVALLARTLAPGERFVVCVEADGGCAYSALGKYSAVAHRAAETPQQATAAALRGTGAEYLLWRGGAAPAGTPTATARAFTLYRLP